MRPKPSHIYLLFSPIYFCSTQVFSVGCWFAFFPTFTIFVYCVKMFICAAFIFFLLFLSPFFTHSFHLFCIAVTQFNNCNLRAFFVFIFFLFQIHALLNFIIFFSHFLSLKFSHCVVLLDLHTQNPLLNVC